VFVVDIREAKNSLNNSLAKQRYLFSATGPTAQVTQLTTDRCKNQPVPLLNKGCARGDTPCSERVKRQNPIKRYPKATNYALGVAA